MYQNEAQLLKAPTKEPIHLEEAKLHRRVDSSDEDEFIKACITAARFHAEAITWRKYVLSTYVQHFDIFPKSLFVNKNPSNKFLQKHYKNNVFWFETHGLHQKTIIKIIIEE